MYLSAKEKPQTKNVPVFHYQVSKSLKIIFVFLRIFSSEKVCACFAHNLFLNLKNKNTYFNQVKL